MSKPKPDKMKDFGTKELVFLKMNQVKERKENLLIQDREGSSLRKEPDMPTRILRLQF